MGHLSGGCVGLDFLGLCGLAILDLEIKFTAGKNLQHKVYFLHVKIYEWG